MNETQLSFYIREILKEKKLKEGTCGYSEDGDIDPKNTDKLTPAGPSIQEALSPEVLKRAELIKNTIVGKNRDKIVKKYGPEAEKVIHGRAIKQAQQQIEKEQGTEEIEEVSSEKQRKYMCAVSQPGAKRPKGLTQAKAKEMCKDTALSKKKLQEDIIDKTDFVLPRGKKMILQAEDEDYNRGLIVELTNEGGYKMYYWYGDDAEIYPVEVEVDGESIKPDAREVYMKFHPELKENKNMENTRLNELVKAALMGPVKEANAFIVAADKAKDAGKKEFEFPKGSGKMHPVKIKADIDEVGKGYFKKKFGIGKKGFSMDKRKELKETIKDAKIKISEGSYPFDECVADNEGKYGEEGAKRVCGAIRAAYGEGLVRGNINEALNKPLDKFGQDLEKRLNALGFETKVFGGQSSVPSSAVDQILKNPKLAGMSYAKLKPGEASNISDRDYEYIEIVVNAQKLNQLKKVKSYFQTADGNYGPDKNLGWIIKNVRKTNPGDIIGSEIKRYGDKAMLSYYTSLPVGPKVKTRNA